MKSDMGNMNYEVRGIPSSETHIWVTDKHYAKRLPPINYAFGLYDQDKYLQGICTFGIPASRFEEIPQPYELNRLIVNDGLPKNVLSYFVSQCLKMFPQPNIIVSYADPNAGHCGYIYQATNWMYSGLTSPDKEWWIDGRLLHKKTIWNIWGTNDYQKLLDMSLGIDHKSLEPKHRYFYLVGNRKWKREMINLLAVRGYKSLPYPKFENRRYDASFRITPQGVLL